jgi:hypothetical protein
MSKLGLLLLAAGPVVGLALITWATWFAQRSIRAGPGEAAVSLAYAQVRVASFVGISIAASGFAILLVSWHRSRIHG